MGSGNLHIGIVAGVVGANYFLGLFLVQKPDEMIRLRCYINLVYE